MNIYKDVDRIHHKDAYFDGLDLADTTQTPTWANDMRRSSNMFKLSIF